MNTLPSTHRDSTENRLLILKQMAPIRKIFKSEEITVIDFRTLFIKCIDFEGYPFGIDLEFRPEEKTWIFQERCGDRKQYFGPYKVFWRYEDFLEHMDIYK